MNSLIVLDICLALPKIPDFSNAPLLSKDPLQENYKQLQIILQNNNCNQYNNQDFVKILSYQLICFPTVDFGPLW